MVIIEDGTEEIPTWKRLNGFKIDDEDAVRNEVEKRKDDDDGLVDAPVNKIKLG